ALHLRCAASALWGRNRAGLSGGFAGGCALAVSLDRAGSRPGLSRASLPDLARGVRAVGTRGAGATAFEAGGPHGRNGLSGKRAHTRDAEKPRRLPGHRRDRGQPADAGEMAAAGAAVRGAGAVLARPEARAPVGTRAGQVHSSVAATCSIFAQFSVAFVSAPE